MKRRFIWLGIPAVVVLAAAISLVAKPTAPEWTTSSPEALEEFEAALDAESKLYYPEAVRRFERAIELDPDFVMAKVMLVDKLRGYDEERARALADEVAETDQENLRPRERLYVNRLIASRDRRFDDVEALLDEYLEIYPDDPMVLKNKAGRAFGLRDYESAERLYRRLLEISPNEVIAYNQLGYVAMFQGRFSEAEEYLTSYRFIAPDQANPHDSLGELYVIQGRYEDAETSFENAIAIRPDFMESYGHLMFVYALMGDHARAQQVLERFESVGPDVERYAAEWRCVLEFWKLDDERSWRELVDRASSECVTKHYPASFMSLTVHRAACERGNWKLAAAIEAKVEEVLEEAKENGYSMVIDRVWPAFLHMQGIRLAKQGEVTEAEQKFREVDAQVIYKDAVLGWFKLYNRSLLAETLLAQGRDGDAHTMLAKLRAVNPAMVSEFEERGLKELGLDRG
jgi:tetratricopeptide (TPR) repeat protein